MSGMTSYSFFSCLPTSSLQVVDGSSPCAAVATFSLRESYSGYSQPRDSSVLGSAVDSGTGLMC